MTTVVDLGQTFLPVYLNPLLLMCPAYHSLWCLQMTVHVYYTVKSKEMKTLEPYSNTLMAYKRERKIDRWNFTLHKRKPIRQPYNIHGHILEEVNEVNFLHIDFITKKANNTRSFLKGNIHQYPREIICYISAARTIFSDYRSIICITQTLKQLQCPNYPKTQSSCKGDHDVPHGDRPSWSSSIPHHDHQLCKRAMTSLFGILW